MNMNFNNFYNQIFESLNGSNLLALDGRREVYICNVYIEEYYNTKELDSIQIIPIRRMPEDGLQYWDKDTGEKWDMFIRKFDTLEKALESLATEYLMSQDSTLGPVSYVVGQEYYFEPQAAELIKDKLRELFKPYLHLPGQWGYSAFGEHDILEFGIEIDIATYRMGGLLSVTADNTTDEEGSIMDL